MVVRSSNPGHDSPNQQLSEEEKLTMIANWLRIFAISTRAGHLLMLAAAILQAQRLRT